MKKYSLLCALLLGLVIQSIASFAVPQTVKYSPVTFNFEPDLAPGTYRYFVLLDEQPITVYRGGIKGLAATHKGKAIRKFNPHSSKALQYKQYLQKAQRTFLQRAESQLGRKTNPVFDYQYALNGMVLELTQQEAMKLSKMPSVKSVQRDIPRKLHTHSGPSWVGADQVWSGMGVDEATQGEGVVVAIFDTGINTGNPSFAEVAADGYQHTNPKGEYFGDCISEPSLCNDKLIGVYSSSRITDTYNGVRPANGEDYNGHGSHTAGTVAGNLVTNETEEVIYKQISGVAPRANIVSFQVCDHKDDGTGACYPSLTAAFVEEAIQIGVDVINYSVGGSASDPWSTPDSLAFLSAREAGIHVAVSAGNEGGDGSGTISSPADSPWLSSVAAYTRNYSGSSNQISFSGGSSSLSNMTGASLSEIEYTAAIVWAGDYENPNDPNNDSADCLQPFPAGTFNGEIVVCRRGDIARVEKSSNVELGGAGGFVLINSVDEGASLNADNHAVPATHLTFSNGQTLTQWLSSGSGHTATIGAANVSFDIQRADFSSLGPNPSAPDTLSPTMAAPGVSVFAPYADDKPEELTGIAVEASDAANFQFLSGTSMASPHVAGALALIDSVKPQWSPAEAQSALMLTANPATLDCLSCDNPQASEPFDQGSGMINVKSAINSSLVMDISVEDYQDADEELGGDPSKLNMPALVSASCVNECVFTRIVKATIDNAWSLSVETDAGISAQVAPQNFSLQTGEEQQIVVTVDLSNADPSNWSFGRLTLTSQQDTLTMPLAVLPATDNVPNVISFATSQDTGSSQLDGLVSNQLTNVQAQAYGFDASLEFSGTVDEDPNPDNTFFSYFNGNQELDFNSALPTGLSFQKIVAENPVQLLYASLSSSNTTSTDADIYFYVDSDGDGLSNEIVAGSLSSGSDESFTLTNLQAGDYYIVIHNYQATDTVNGDEFLVNLVVADELSTRVTAEIISSDEDDQFSLKLNWEQPFIDSQQITGAVVLSSVDSQNQQVIRVSMSRNEEQVSVDSPLDDIDNTLVEPNQSLTFRVSIPGNTTLGAQQYLITATLPTNQTVDESSISEGGVLSASQIRWQFTHELDAVEKMLSFNLNIKAAGSNTVTFTEVLDGNPERIISSITFEVQNNAPIAEISGDTSVNETDTVSLSGSASYDENGDSLTYSWIQIAGTSVSFDSSAETISFAAPEVDQDTTLTFQLTVNDGELDSSPITHNVAVIDQSQSDGSGGASDPDPGPNQLDNSSGSGGGSFNFWLLVLSVLILQYRLIHRNQAVLLKTKSV